MIKLGIKVGPQSRSLTDLHATNPAMAEVWFHINKKNDYSNLFSYLKRHRIETGLHFWGVTTNGIYATIATIISDNANDIWQHLLKTTKQLLPQTKLLHLGFIIPPYNGTDLHDMLDAPIFETDKAIPNKQQMIELLKLFMINNQDVWALVEPKENHVKNYFLAKKLLANPEHPNRR